MIKIQLSFHQLNSIKKIKVSIQHYFLPAQGWKIKELPILFANTIPKITSLVNSASRVEQVII